ncbi:MAG: transglutaminase domain-containing protein [Planctomycetaceae bacterium]|nr:transglutaminase domain-containing protein [Planctomycetaceae bacterium]
MKEFLVASDVIDYEHSAVRSLVAELGRGAEPAAVAARCFHWVRDNIRHSIDHQDEVVTLSASDVLQQRTGLCYAKSHLLAALLRANGIPCGFVYQRLALDDLGTSFCLHGLNAVWLTNHGWYRADPRGNRDGISTSFDPPQEHLAFVPTLPGEKTIERVFANPLPVVISTLRQYTKLNELCANLPDWPAESPNVAETLHDSTAAMRRGVK